MCRNIRLLFNFDPPATQEEIRAASIQFVRKVSGTHKPSKINETVFDEAVTNISKSVQTLLAGLVTQAPTRDRESEKAKAQAKNAQRFNRP